MKLGVCENVILLIAQSRTELNDVKSLKRVMLDKSVNEIQCTIWHERGFVTFRFTPNGAVKNAYPS